MYKCKTGLNKSLYLTNSKWGTIISTIAMDNYQCKISSITVEWFNDKTASDSDSHLRTAWDKFNSWKDRWLHLYKKGQTNPDSKLISIADIIIIYLKSIVVRSVYKKQSL